MRKLIKIILSIFSAAVLIAILVPVVLAILLSSHTFQNFAVDRAAKAASEYLGTTVSIDKINIRLFNRVVVKGLYVEDFHGDTLLYVSGLDAGFRGYNTSNRTFRLGDVSLEGASFFIVQDSTLTTNLSQVMQKLKSEKEKERKDFLLRANSLTVTDTRFRLKKFIVKDRPYGINFSDLDVDNINLDIRRIGIVNDSINAEINSISFSEKSGFVCEKLSAANAIVSSTTMNLAKFSLRERRTSLSMDYLVFEYPTWKGYNDFLNDVRIRSFMNGCDVSFSTIAYFAPSLREWKNSVVVTGTVDGPVSDMAVDMENARILDTRMAFSGRMTGIPDIKNTRFTFDISEFSTNAADIESVYSDISKKSVGAGILEYIAKMNDIALQGRFDGIVSNFTADGSLAGGPGEVVFDIKLNPAASGRTGVEGNVSVDNFAMGEFLEIRNMGTATFAAGIDGVVSGDSLSLAADAIVKHMAFNGYDYTGINIEGDVGDRYFKGYIESGDPNIDFDVNGTFDFRTDKPSYDFLLNLRNADLNKLNINKRDSVSLLSCVVTANIEGATLNDINGTGHINDLQYLFNADTLSSKEIVFSGDNTSDNKLVSFYSDFADLEMRSKLNFYDIAPYFKSTLKRYLPSLSVDSVQMAQLETHLDLSDPNSPDNYYVINGKVKENNKLAAAITSGLEISEGTELSFMFNPAQDNFSLMLNSEYIQFKNLFMVDLNVTGITRSDSISVFLRTSEMEAAGFYMHDLSVIGRVENNRIDLGVGFENQTNGVSTLLNTTTLFTTDSLSEALKLDTRFSSSVINFEDQTWRVSSPRITYIPSKKTIDIESFRIYRQGEEFAVKGVASPSPSDTLYVNINNFDLKPLSGLVEKYVFDVRGRLNGDAQVMATTGNVFFFSEISLSDLTINNRPMRNSVFNSRWDYERNRVNFFMTALPDDNILRGVYTPSERNYNIDVRIPDLELALLQPILGGTLADIEGSADTDLKVTSNGGRPLINGTVNVKKFDATVDFTKVRYSLRENTIIDVSDNNFRMRATKLYDGLGGEGDVPELSLRTTYLTNINYDIRINPRRMLALNTTELDNDLFYGKAYASGSLAIKGDRRSVKMDINAQTENNSTFFMPLATSTSVGEADFITYTSPGRNVDSVQLRRQEIIRKFREARTIASTGSNLDIDMFIRVLPNTEVQIDPAIGNTIKGNGTGGLTMKVKPSEDLFTIVGDYRINEGSYEFRSSYIPTDKRFSIEQGSSIQWTGDPLEALINITAVYRIRTSIAPLMGGGDNRFRQNVPVNCKVTLTDMLLQPTITFDVEVPTADTEIQSIVKNAMATQEMKSTQFLYLLATNKFYSESSTGGNANIGTAATVSTGIEFLTNQISNIVSSDNYKLNFGYRPRSELSSDEIDISYEQEVIPDRLIIEAEANYNLGNNPSATIRNENQLTGDFYITYIIDRMGNLRASAFSRTVDRFDENQGLHENGLGIYYKRDFNKFGDLFRRRRLIDPLIPTFQPSPTVSVDARIEEGSEPEIPDGK